MNDAIWTTYLLVIDDPALVNIAVTGKNNGYRNSPCPVISCKIEIVVIRCINTLARSYSDILLEIEVIIGIVVIPPS